MKILTSSLLLGAFLLCSFDTADQAKITYKRFKFKSGVIEYKFTGDQTGAETLYFDDHGMTMSRHTNAVLKIGKQTTVIKKLDLIKNGFNYIVDLDANTGTRIKDPTLRNLNEGEENDLTGVAADNFRAMGGEKIGTETVAGKECDVWELANIGLKVWVWEGITLRTTEKIAGLSEINMVAWNVQTGVPIPDDKIRIPPGANITENDEKIDIAE